MSSLLPSLDLIRQLSSNPELLRRFLDSIGDALFVVDAEHNIVYWNQRAEALTGYSEREVLGQHCLAGIRCEGCLRSCTLFQRGRIENTPITLTAKDGRELNVRKSAFVLRDASGEILGGVELLRDETALNQQISQCTLQRSKIEERERLQAAILRSVREGVVTIDQDWRITSFSPKAEQMSGYRAEEAIGRYCHDIIGSSLCKTDCPAQHCLEQGEDEAERATAITQAQGKALPVVEIAAPLRDEQGVAIGSLLILEDRSQAQALSDPGDRSGFMGIIGASKPMRRVFQIIEQVAVSDVTVLLTGESGTGKERVARAIHQLSKRRLAPFQAINCAALPETLLESELFGHAKGAFTGAQEARAGRIEAAQGGTLFLDEIGEMPITLQSKLLRFLQERDYQRLGENEVRRADVRVLAATNRNLPAEVQAGRFREDLYYRINVIPIPMPALRERAEDVALLAVHLLKQISAERNRPGLSLTPAAIRQMSSYSWPGNVRELINALEYAVALAPGRKIRPEDLPLQRTVSQKRYISQDETESGEEHLIREALRLNQQNRSQAAAYLGMNRVTLYRKMKKYGIE